MQEILIDACDVIVDKVGFNKPLTTTTLSDTNNISTAITLQYTLIQCLAELEQLKKGLASLGFLKIMQDNADIVEPFFTSTGIQTLTAGNTIFFKLFHLNYLT